MIRSQLAFQQKYDMETANDVTTFYSDVDMTTELPNKKFVVHEFKKDTLNHTPKQIIQTEQWQKVRKLAGTENYAIYSTHHEKISDKDIPFEKLFVRYVELNKQSISFPKGITLHAYLNKLGSINMYYIVVTYPNNQKEFAIISPKSGERWTTLQYLSRRCAFKTKEVCEQYIKTRYKKEYNREYIYSIYYKDSFDTAKLIKAYTYNDMNKE